MRTRRSVLAPLCVALVVLPVATQAQARPSGAQLECMIAKALADPDTVTFARPRILGFADQQVITHQLKQVRGDRDYSFAVTNPRLPDGLVFFLLQPTMRTYRMHRTDTHLRRVASATNDLRLGEKGLAGWEGPASDRDFVRQLDVWADFNCLDQVAGNVMPRPWDSAGRPPVPRPSAR